MRGMEVGVRELRSQLSRWIGHARQGREILITDRGRPVARLVPVEGESAIEQLIALGIATPPASTRRDDLTPPTVRPRGGSVTELLLEQRRGNRR